MLRNYDIKWAAETGWVVGIAALVYLAQALQEGSADPDRGQVIISALAGAGRLVVALVAQKVFARFTGAGA